MKYLPRLEELPTLLMPKNPDGKEGSNRSPSKSLINANNDLEAIESWLQEYAHKKTTYQSYRKEAERLLLWRLIAAKKPLSSLNREDFTAYGDFLRNPQPKPLWCGRNPGRKVTRGGVRLWKGWGGEI